MPCYHPIPAQMEYTNRAGQVTRKRLILHPKGEPSHWLPCGTCIGCREIQQQQIALRFIHESKKHEHKHFLTLTYDDAHLPNGLQKDHMQKFWKRVRKQTNERIKTLYCGEYGDRTQRAHYHAAVLGLPINDQKKWDSENNTSKTISNHWKNGIVTVSELTDERIRYVAGYVLKKAGYKKQIYCDEHGEEIQAPYRQMSKGLGKSWLEKYASDLRNGYLQHEGAKNTIPRYYTDWIKKNKPELHTYIENEKAKNWKALTEQDRKLLHNGEKIRLKEIREHTRDKV